MHAVDLARMQAVQWYGIAIVLLGSTTLALRVIGCFVYVLTQAWAFSPSVPPSLRRCRCCRRDYKAGLVAMHVAQHPSPHPDDSVANPVLASPIPQAVPSQQSRALVVAVPSPAVSQEAVGTQLVQSSAAGGGTVPEPTGPSEAAPAGGDVVGVLGRRNDSFAFRSFRMNPLSVKKQGGGGGAVMSPLRPLLGDDGVPASKQPSVTGGGADPTTEAALAGGGGAVAAQHTGVPQSGAVPQ